MKRLIVKANETTVGGSTVQIGYDVGWDIWSPLDEKWVQRYWGNTRDHESFARLVEDAKTQHEFELGESALAMLRG